ncbi:hypothetical protein V6N13_097671 [Hibiscus sabdariffa]|uniref:Uncharacterized protein n=1 Tax=Hibiscus sabdariffa TaxID=183260 RepID=A0ABR2NK45_9ROSI
MEVSPQIVLSPQVNITEFSRYNSSGMPIGSLNSRPPDNTTGTIGCDSEIFGHSKEGCSHIALSANVAAIFSVETTCGDQANETIMNFSTFQPKDNQTVEYGPRMHVSGRNYRSSNLNRDGSRG